MRNSRNWNQIRTPLVSPDFCGASRSSLLIEMGNTKVICAASVSDDVPDHAASKGMGWLTAEYSMLPYSTHQRTARPLLRRDGRAVEIQRLIGRCLRGAVDLMAMPSCAITIDCDVLQADGGTRTAAITGGFIALKGVLSFLKQKGMITANPLVTQIAAVSVGIVRGEMLLDLDYSEDREADVDLNVVMDRDGRLIEVQGTGEGRAFSRDELNSLLDLAGSGIRELMALQDRY